MPTDAFTSAGSTLAASAALPATYDQAGYEALTFTVLAEVTVIPAYGKEFNLVTHNPIGDRKTYKFKGSYNNGSVPMQMARVPSDAGQAILTTALESDDGIAFEVTLADTSIQYFTGKVMSYTTEINSVDSITSATVNIEIDDDVVDVPAP